MDTQTKDELNLENLRGQGYDGAGNMSGKVKGASTIILKKYTFSGYTLKLHMSLYSVQCTLYTVDHMY